MKITDIVWEKLRVELTQPFRIAFAEVSAAESIIIKVSTDEGLVGYGEAAPFVPVTGETPDSVTAALKLLKPALIGLDPFDIEYIHEVMDTAIHGNGAAKCAVDIAMYDLMGKACGKPVYKLLGGYQKEVQNDITVSLNTPEEMVDTAERYVKEGFRILKVKAGVDVETDIQTIALIRKKVGNHIRIRVDANQGYDIAKALCAIDGFKKSKVEAVEQCLPYWDCEGAAVLYSRANGMSIMLDESIHTPKDAYRFVTAGCADFLNIKLMKCGGLLPGLKISDIAEAGGVRCMVGCLFETKLSLTAGLSLVAARKNITEADCDSFTFFKEPDNGMDGGFIRDKDKFILLDKPGLGIELSF